MSNKTQLQANNTILDNYISRINAAKDVAAGLPEAGAGGGTIESCTITINSLLDPGTSIYYVDGNMTFCVGDLVRKGDSFTIPKNSIFVLTSTGVSISGAVQKVTRGMYTVYQVTG